MNYYLDQEFHEYFKKPIYWLPTIGNFNKPYHTIELISIGIVAEDGREYYAVCNEFDLRYAQNNRWLNDNVLIPISSEFYRKESSYAKYHHSGSLTLRNFLKWKGKSKNKIAKEIKDFIMCSGIFHKEGCDLSCKEPKFYGYYSDYDWVLFCSLFGTMMDLPKGYPMYCKDLQQMKDDWIYRSQDDPDQAMKIKSIDNHPMYPKQENEHNALSDAKWNKELHHFLRSL